MEYTAGKLAKISGVSTRTLRYYDQIGLLCPTRISNGYRIYGQAEIDLLQQILFYRQLDVSLEEIGRILRAPDYDKEQALISHLSSLLSRKAQLELLIGNVRKTLSTMKGEAIMTDSEKFQGFKQRLIDDNEAVYGKEIRGKYGDDAINVSNEKIKAISSEGWQSTQELSALINETLKEAFETGDPAGEAAQKACELHKKWLCTFWKDGAYSKEAHMALGEGYVSDERFTKYYDKIAVGCTKFFRDAINIYCGR